MAAPVESPLRNFERTSMSSKYFLRVVLYMTDLLAWLVPVQPIHAKTWNVNGPLSVARLAHTAIISAV
jgi:hypothetical protein